MDHILTIHHSFTPTLFDGKEASNAFFKAEVNFMCQLNWAMEFPDTYLNIFFLVCVCELLLE